MRLVLELKAVVSDTPVEGVLDVATVVTYARVEGSRAMRLNPCGQSKAMVKCEHLDGQIIVFSVEVESSVVKGIRIILLDSEFTGTTEELDDPGVRSGSTENGRL